MASTMNPCGVLPAALAARATRAFNFSGSLRVVETVMTISGQCHKGNTTDANRQQALESPRNSLLATRRAACYFGGAGNVTYGGGGSLSGGTYAGAASPAGPRWRT